ncbi:MAG TPA: DUF2480 family protein [Chitinophagales bacterium]|nr:DUF2480 family protein [Chitinophagales bacterium]
MTEPPLINRIEQSGIITLDLAEFFPREEIAEFDLKKFLVRELVLMEKPFREAMKNIDWNSFDGKVVAVFCSNDAIIPMWAYMLAASLLQPHAARIFFGNKSQAQSELLREKIEKMNAEEFRDAKVVIKGCGEQPLPPDAYIAITNKLQPVVHSLMYGEPCSTVPVYKRAKLT